MSVSLSQLEVTVVGCGNTKRVIRVRQRPLLFAELIGSDTKAAWRHASCSATLLAARHTKVETTLHYLRKSATLDASLSYRLQGYVAERSTFDLDVVAVA